MQMPMPLRTPAQAKASKRSSHMGMISHTHGLKPQQRCKQTATATPAVEAKQQAALGPRQLPQHTPRLTLMRLQWPQQKRRPATVGVCMLMHSPLGRPRSSRTSLPKCMWRLRQLLVWKAMTKHLLPHTSSATLWSMLNCLPRCDPAHSLAAASASQKTCCSSSVMRVTCVNVCAAGLGKVCCQRQVLQEVQRCACKDGNRGICGLIQGRVRRVQSQCQGRRQCWCQRQGQGQDKSGMTLPLPCDTCAAMTYVSPCSQYKVVVLVHKRNA
jgi:hypothetical protein